MDRCEICWGMSWSCWWERASALVFLVPRRETSRAHWIAHDYYTVVLLIGLSFLEKKLHRFKIWSGPRIALMTPFQVFTSTTKGLVASR